MSMTNYLTHWVCFVIFKDLFVVVYASALPSCLYVHQVRACWIPRNRDYLMVMSQHVCAGNWTRIFCKSNNALLLTVIKSSELYYQFPGVFSNKKPV